jgi:Protein of unknown function (DUF433)
MPRIQAPAAPAFAASRASSYPEALKEKPTKPDYLLAHVRIAADPKVMMGKPCIRGARITVELILRKLGAGGPLQTSSKPIRN